MAFDVVNSALEFAHLSDAGLAKFATELGWVATGYPEQTQADVARLVRALCRRHGHAVREILVRATQEHASALVDKNLSESCLLRLFHDVVRSVRSAGGLSLLTDYPNVMGAHQRRAHAP